ncbi:MAG: cation transporter [Rubinisphaera brasiliensis]|uniref:cation transporter n=1 Tax=Rubinisphaera brasiliensis TaxID=119 RepID=UPI00391AF39A
MLRSLLALSVCLTVAAFSAAELPAEEAAKPTIVHVGEMCGGCANKVHKRFDDDKHVLRVECDIDENTITFYPVSKPYTARYLWVELDQIGKTPTKLIGPDGTFTSKPKE